jgi:glutamate-1-semialdehyde 2,1-aminomutase
VQDTLVARYNDLDSIRQLFETYPEEIAAIILEPVAGNMGVVLPEAGFLQGLREITQEYGTLLIFDEVMTGFRVHPGGAQTLYGIQPDLTTLGKVIGGGLPVGAYGGTREIMSMIAPSGPVYQAGTLSGNPLAMAAGIATLKALGGPGVWQTLEDSSQKLAEGVGAAAQSAGIPVWQNRVGTMFATFFTKNPVKDWPSAKTCDTEIFGKFFQGMLERGIYLAPSQFEAGFMSTAHGEVEIQATIQAAEETFKTW